MKSKAAMISFVLTLSGTVVGEASTLISRRSQKIPSNGLSGEAAASETGQFVAFRSAATNLDGERCNNGLNQIFVSDRNSGIIRCVSLDSNGRQGDQDSLAPSISADGRYVAFTSNANLAGNECDNAFNHIYVRDRTSGTTTCVSVNSNGQEANQDSEAASISADGTLIAFDSAATNLAANKCDNGFNHIFLRNVATGATTCLSVRSNGDQGNGDSFDPAISADGRFVVFQSTATNLAARCNNGNSHIYVHNRDTGETICASLNNEDQQSNGNNALARVSADGRFVVFQGDSTNVTKRCSNGSAQIFVRDLVEQRTTCSSIDNQGNQGNQDSLQPSISADGRFVVFSSEATNLSGGRCANGTVHVFVRDRADEKTKCVSLGRKKVAGNGESASPSISGNGSRVVFESDANNLIKNDTNSLRDVFAAENSTGNRSSFFIFFDQSEPGGATGGFFAD